MKKIISEISIVALLFIACNSSKKTTESVNPTLAGTYWKITELKGQPVVKSDAKEKDYYLKLDPSNNRISAFAGCNQMMGSFTTQEGNRITFSQLASTMKACPNMKDEDVLKEILESADNYAISGNILSLNKARMAPLAKFVAVPEPK
jgi:heat shock protein HslJ